MSVVGLERKIIPKTTDFHSIRRVPSARFSNELRITLCLAPPTFADRNISEGARVFKLIDVRVTAVIA